MLSFILIFGPAVYVLNVATQVLLIRRTSNNFSSWLSWVAIVFAPVALLASALALNITRDGQEPDEG